MTAEVKHWHRPPELDARGKVGECVCSHASSRHGRRKPPGSPAWELTGCSVAGCGCTRYRNKDGSGWPFGVGP